MKVPPAKRLVFSRSGFAIVVVLAAAVLLVGVVLAFFSNAVLQRQISESSASHVKTDIFSHGAVDTIVSDLKAEIKASSTATNIVTGTASTMLYFPTAASDMIPSLAGSAGANGLENLVKRSSGTNAFSSGATNRASTISTTRPANDGRVISPARWNKPLLLPPTSATDLTPTASAGFVAPDWVYVSRDGSNPTTWNSSLKTSRTDTASAVGRYAFTIYDEGGLLDVNAAGAPSGVPGDAIARKSSLAHAELGVIFELAGFTSARAGEIVNALATWRNEATLQNISNFDTWATFNPKGFLATANTDLASSKSDRIFTSRQQLQKFLLEKVAVAGEAGMMELALNYLSTFTRALNQPSFVPASSKGGPVIAADESNGGNDAYGGDAVINPSFQTVRVTGEFDRNEKDPVNPAAFVKARIGEPLVRKRFDLNRLAWLTYAGPITLDGTTYNTALDAAYVNTLKSTYGFTDKFLFQGTPTNIFNDFGLSWIPAGGRNVWFYNHQGSSVLSSAPASGASIRTLNALTASREPDFVELLKAGITAGSLAKGATLPNGLSIEIAQSVRDTSLDYAILQITANLIDQYDLDGYPTQIRFSAGGGTAVKEFRGVENLPYYYRNHVGLVETVLPVPSPTNDTRDSKTPGYDDFATAPLVNTGFYVALIQPQIWNPHDQNASSGSPRPQNFRLVVDTAPLDADGNATASYNKVSFKASAGKPNQNIDSTAGDTARPNSGFFASNGYQEDPVELRSTNTALEFEVPNNTLFREPTLLVTKGIPSGSNLRLGAGNYLNVSTKFASTPAASYFTGDGVTIINNPSTGTGASLGIYLGVAPLRWVRTTVSGTTPTSKVYSANRQVLTISSDSGDPAMTFRMQYRDASGNWITYDEKYVRAAATPPWIYVRPDGLPDMDVAVGKSSQYNGALSVGVDPRSSRFGAAQGLRGSIANAWNAMSWLDQNENIMTSMRPDSGIGATAGYLDTSAPTAFTGLPSVPGWYPSGGTTPGGGATGNWIFGGGQYQIGYLSQNNPAVNPNQTYYADPDGVVRRAMGAWWSASTSPATLGLPMAKTTGGPANQSQSRPVVLERLSKILSECPGAARPLERCR